MKQEEKLYSVNRQMEYEQHLDDTLLQEAYQKLIAHELLSHEEFVALLSAESPKLQANLEKEADRARREQFGNRIYIRGLIEFTNYCKNDCYYCGIRKSNGKAVRYRLTEEEILSCCDAGYELGFRTFVLQGGEDAYFTDERMCAIVAEIHEKYPDCAITLSLGERSRESYERLFKAGAERYLLRQETADRAHYEKLHPEEMSFENRMRCLSDLKEIGYQVGCGFMVGSPYQTVTELAKDFCFIQSLRPHMVGIGPFLSHKDTPFCDVVNGTLSVTLRCLSILRILQPSLLLPATTALGTIHPRGRELGILAGANVVMPNLSPQKNRKQYMLYDNKICTGEESAECINCMTKRMETIGFRVVTDRGDSPLSN